MKECNCERASWWTVTKYVALTLLFTLLVAVETMKACGYPTYQALIDDVCSR